LNTQEFYLGLQSSIETETLAHYLAAGVNPKVLLPLFISEIEVDNPDANTRAVLHGDGSSKSYRPFVSAINSLILDGLTVQQSDKSDEKKFGPVLTKQQASDPKFLSALVQAMSSASGGSAFNLKEIKSKNGEPEFQLTKPGGKSDEFCFMERLNVAGKQRTNLYEREAVELSSLQSNSVPGGVLPLIYYYGKPLPAAIWKFDKNSCLPSLSSRKPRVKLNLRTRSVEEIFNFLGELVRTQLGLGSTAQPLDHPTCDVDPTCDMTGNPDFLFKVEQRLPSDGEISATIHGYSYVISVDPSGNNASTQVVQLLSDLLALQSNAKDLPASNVIAVVP
jgi:hypothetical protein